MSWMERFSGAVVTVSVMVADPLRPCASEIEIGRDFVPGVVATVTTVENENVLFPA